MKDKRRPKKFPILLRRIVLADGRAYTIGPSFLMPYRRHQRNATHWLGRLARREPNLFYQWQIGVRPATGQ
jgi:hypothetical protein